MGNVYKTSDVLQILNSFQLLGLQIMQMLLYLMQPIFPTKIAKSHLVFLQIFVVQLVFNATFLNPWNIA